MGARTIVATPHVSRHYPSKAQEIARLTAELNDRLAGEGVARGAPPRSMRPSAGGTAARLCPQPDPIGPESVIGRGSVVDNDVKVGAGAPGPLRRVSFTSPKLPPSVVSMNHLDGHIFGFG